MAREPAARWATAFLVVAASYALFAGVAWQGERLAETAATETEGETLLAEERSAAASEESGGRVGGARTFVALPPGPLSALSVGLGDLYPERAEISIWKRPDTLFGRYQLESPLSLLAGRFDLGFVVIFLLPLFALALSYDLLAAEREGGTLPLVLTGPVSLHRLVSAKILARLVWLTVSLTVIVGAAAVVAGEPLGRPGRLLGWFGVAWLYGVFWLCLAAWVATRVRRSENAAAALATSWLALVCVLPGLLNVAVLAGSPTPSRLEFVTSMRAASSEASRASAELLSEFYHEHPELAANGRQGGFLPAFYASEREIERRLVPLMAEYDERLEAQQRLVATWSWLSPAVLANEALVELAGTGIGRQRAAAEQARAFLAEWHGALSPRIFLGQGLAPEDYDALPTFRFAEPPVSVSRVLGGLGGLAALIVLTLALARRRLARVEVAS